MTKYSDMIRKCADLWIEDNDDDRLSTYAGEEVSLPPKKCHKGKLYVFDIYGHKRKNKTYIQCYKEITKAEIIYNLSTYKYNKDLTSTQFNAIYRAILAISPMLSDLDIKYIGLN